MKSKRILALTGAVILIALYGIAVLHDRYTGGALWVCGGTAVF